MLDDTRLLRLVADDNGDGLSDLFLAGQRIEPGSAETASAFGAPSFLEHLAAQSASFA